MEIAVFIVETESANLGLHENLNMKGGGNHKRPRKLNFHRGRRNKLTR